MEGKYELMCLYVFCMYSYSIESDKERKSSS